MGVAAGDVDNDGFVDLYRTGLTEGVLLHNNGNGTFTDITAKSGTANKGGWGVSASFVDIDRDGWLDLFVGNYLLYSVDGDIDCLSVTGQHDYCPPNSYRPQPSKLYPQPRQRHVRGRHARRRSRAVPTVRRSASRPPTSTTTAGSTSTSATTACRISSG